MSAHAECSHDASKSARARCRRSKRDTALTGAEKRAERFADVLRTEGWDVCVEVRDYVSEPYLPPRRYVSMRAYNERGVYASISSMWVTILPNDMGRRESTRWIGGNMYRSYAKKRNHKFTSQQDFVHWLWILAH